MEPFILFLVALDIFKPQEEQLYSENWNVYLFEKLNEKSSLVGLIDYFRILKALINLSLLFVCMSYVFNQNGKVQEETLTEPNSVVMKATLRRLRYFKMILPLLPVLQKSLLISVSFWYIQRKVLQMAL